MYYYYLCTNYFSIQSVKWPYKIALLATVKPQILRQFQHAFSIVEGSQSCENTKTKRAVSNTECVGIIFINLIFSSSIKDENSLTQT